MFPAEDSFISDEEVEYCPLCVEEMDISDKHFKPCPCGYQICQFCYNNIRQNPELNGRCPGCRRLYDDESVEYKTLSAEEYKSQQLKKERREREKKQKEKEKKESEIASKKHLAGLRVVQKNLVYVTGLNPPYPSDDLHSILRSDKYFGQYGKILKIVVNRKAPVGAGAGASHVALGSNSGIVVYVTFARKDDALRCINELDGSMCDGRVLRAAHGTTKYCSSYLRGHPCPNPNCMFLHEPGEEADSYTRKDLSTHQGIKMGMSGSPTGSTANLHSFHFSEDDHQSDDERDRERERGYASHTPQASHAAPVLPATAHWAKPQNSESASASPSVANANVNANVNVAAFPTLGEIFKEQKTQKKDAKKSKNKGRDAGALPDDVDLDDHSVLQFVDDSSARLRALADASRRLPVHFEHVADAASVAPFFRFDSSLGKAQSASLAEEKVLAIHVIEKFLLRPMKKYHLAYANQPSGQQQFLQQQAQFQQQQAQTFDQEDKGTPQRVPTRMHESVSQQQQQQQQMLMAQLQSQNPAASRQTPQMPSQLNALKMSERSKTSTPPPPGLFAKGQEPMIQQQMAHAPPSSSSQLLTQLMSGKR